jgi:hypothetical protein
MAALIAYLLLRATQIRYHATLGLQAIARLMPSFILVRRTLLDLLSATDPGPPNAQTRQMELAYA